MFKRRISAKFARLVAGLFAAVFLFSAPAFAGNLDEIQAIYDRLTYDSQNIDDVDFFDDNQWQVIDTSQYVAGVVGNSADSAEKTTCPAYAYCSNECGASGREDMYWLYHDDGRTISDLQTELSSVMRAPSNVIDNTWKNTFAQAGRFLCPSNTVGRARSVSGNGYDPGEGCWCWWSKRAGATSGYAQLAPQVNDNVFEPVAYDAAYATRNGWYAPCEEPLGTFNVAFATGSDNSSSPEQWTWRVAQPTSTTTDWLNTSILNGDIDTSCSPGTGENSHLYLADIMVGNNSLLKETGAGTLCFDSDNVRAVAGSSCEKLLTVFAPNGLPYVYRLESITTGDLERLEMCVDPDCSLGSVYDKMDLDYSDDEGLEVQCGMVYESTDDEHPHSLCYYVGYNNGVQYRLYPYQLDYLIDIFTTMFDDSNSADWESVYNGYVGNNDITFVLGVTNDADATISGTCGSGGGGGGGTTTEYTCSAGNYLPANSTTCKTCIEGYYCPGGTWSKDATIVQGLNPCPTGYTSAAGAASRSECGLIQYTITYNLDGGTNAAANPAKYTVTTSTITLANPTKDGYTFDGWYSDSAYTTKVTKIAQGSTGNKTFYAKWTANGVACAAGKYLPANGSTCATCPVGKYCPGGTYIPSTNDQGADACPTEYGAEKESEVSTVDSAAGLIEYAFAPDVTGISSPDECTVDAAYSNASGAWIERRKFDPVVDLLYNTVVGTYYFESMAGYYLSGVNTKCMSTFGTGPSDGVVYNSIKKCDAGYYCPATASVYENNATTCGGTNNPTTLGRTQCATGYTSSAGATACTPITYKVTLDKQSGTGGTSEYYYAYETKGACYYYTSSALSTCIDSSDGQTITVPTRTGYTFGGYWTGKNGTGTMYVDSTGLTKNNLYTAVAGNTTLYAKWTGISYTVKYDANGGTGTTADSSHTYGTAKALTANGFTNGVKKFLGWSKTKTATTATYSDGESVKNLTTTDGDTVTLYAIWGECQPCTPGVGAKCELTVETGYCYYTTECLDGYIDIENDGEYNPQCTANMLTCEPGYYVPAGASECAICTNENYCPGGEYLVLAEADNGLFPCEPGVACGSEGNKSFTKYNISYDLGTGATNNAQNPVQCGVSWSYDDSAWQLTCSSVDKTECARPTDGPVSENPDYCTIAYDDGSQVYVGIEAADRDGYSFYCWHNMDDPDNTCTDDSVRMDDYTYYLEKLANKSDDDPQSVYNIRLQAVWDAWEYDIKYNLNGGSNPSGVRTKYTIESDEYTLPTPTKTGYTFGGWYENSGLTGNAVTKIASGSTGTKTFWAKWNAIEYAITYNLDGGTNNASNPTKYTIETATITLANPTKTGYTFGGWYSDAALKNQVTQIAKGSTGDKTFYAKWTLSSVTCAAGQYLPANSLSCTKCTAGYACPGGTFEYKNTDQGITQCTGATYAGAGAARCTSCPSPYTYDTSAGKTKAEQCTLKTDGGHCVITVGGDAGANCPDGYYCPGDIVVPYGSTGGTVACPDAIQNKPSKWPDNYHDVTKVALDSSWGTGAGHAGDTIDECVFAYDLENSRGTIFAVHSYNSKTGKYDIQAGDGVWMWYKSLKSGYYLGKKWTNNGKDACQVFGEGQPKLYQDALPCPTDAYCPGYDGTIESSGWPKCGDGEYAAETGYCPAIASHTVDTWSAMYRNPTIVKTSFYLDDSAADGSTFLDTGGEFGPCFAEYLLKNDAGTILTMQPYSVQTGKYEAYFDDAETLNFYKDYYAFYASLNPGYYFSKKWSRTQNGETIDWCNGASDGARLWQEAEPCPAGSYCPGLPDALADSISDLGNTPNSWPKCGDTTAYTDIYNKNSCPTTYPNSAAKSSAIEQCWLTTTAGKYVATARADQVQCLANNYCAGGTTVNYGSTGGMQSCATGYESAAGASSCTATEYAITYNLDGGTNNASNPTKYTIETATITLANPTKTGYTFDGWYSDAALKNQVTQIAKGSTGAKTFYAKWTAVSYSITYNLNGGTNAAGAKTSYTIETADYTLPTPTKTGYTFGGWYENSGLTGSAVTKIAKGSTGNKTYWAKWTIKSVTCAAGKYLPANSLSCGDCGAGYACPGGTFEYKNTDQGISQCTGRTKYSASGAASCSNVSSGYYTTGCDADGNGCTGQTQCTGTTYCSGGVKSDCPSGYTANTDAGKTVISQCTISVPAGKYLGTAKGTTTTSCAANTYKAAHTVNYGSTSSCGTCPADYPYSDAGAASADQCYKNGTNTGTRSEPALPTGCAAQTTTACTPGTCTYRIYKSGTTTSCTPTNCVNTHKACTSAATDYYLDSGVAKGCSVLNSAYPKSDGGNITSSSCYGTFSKSGSQVNGTTPTNCSAVTAWNACTPGTCNYTKYASGTVKADCTPTDCTKTVKSVTAKSGYYVNNNTSCSACSGLAGGFYPNSVSDNTGGASACYTNSISGKYVASTNATSATNCAAGSYKGAHTVNYGDTSSCALCATGYESAAGASSCSAIVYTITYELNGGAAATGNPATYTIETATITLAAPTKTGYTFGGWYADAAFKTPVTQIAHGSMGNKTLYAKWSGNTYTVTLNANGGTGGTTSVTATYNEQMPTLASVATMTDFALVGYFDATTGGTKYYNADGTGARVWDKTSDATLYAQWLSDFISVKCDAGKYIATGATVCTATCVAGNYCPGGTFTIPRTGATIDTGINGCTGRTRYAAAGATSCGTVSAGYYTTGCTGNDKCTGQSQCTDATYCSGGIKYDCPTAYTANIDAGKTANTQCQIKTTAGNYVSTAQSDQTTCTAGAYCPGDVLVNWGGTGGRTLCTAGTYNPNTGSSLATACVKSDAGYYVGTNGATAQTACTGATYTDTTGATKCTTCPTATKYADALAQYSYYNTGTIGDHTTKTKCQAVFNSTIDHGTLVNDACYLGSDDDYGTSTSSGASTCWLLKDGLSCDGGYYNKSQYAATRSAVLSNACIAVGAGYWSPTGELTRSQCGTGLTTIGYGAGADEAGDCGRILSYGNKTVYLRSVRKTTPSLNVWMDGRTYYGNAAAGNVSGRIRVRRGDTTYSVYDDSMQ